MSDSLTGGGICLTEGWPSLFVEGRIGPLGALVIIRSLAIGAHQYCKNHDCRNHAGQLLLLSAVCWSSEEPDPSAEYPLPPLGDCESRRQGPKTLGDRDPKKTPSTYQEKAKTPGKGWRLTWHPCRDGGSSSGAAKIMRTAPLCKFGGAALCRLRIPGSHR